MQHELGLQSDELVLGVVQEDTGNYLGSAIAFYTSKGHVISLIGSWAQQRHLFLAPAGCEIVGMHFEGDELCGVEAESVPASGVSSVASVAGRVGSAVDKVEFRMADGSVVPIGGEGGAQCGPWTLEHGELLVAAEQTASADCPGFLGTSIAFYTSFGRVLLLEGGAAPRSHRFASPAGRQICGLAFENGSLTGASTCPMDADLASVSSHQVL